MRATWGGARGLGELLGGSADYFSRVSAYFMMGLVAAIFYLAAVFPIERRFARKEPWSAAAFVLPVAAAWLWYASDHSVWLRDGEPGPLAYATFLLTPVFWLVAILFFREHAREPGAPRAPALFLVSVGFATIRAYDDTVAAIRLSLGRPTGIGGVQFSGPDAAVVLADLACALLLVAVLMRHAAGAGASRRNARRYLVLLGVVAATGVAEYVVTGGAADQDTGLGSAWNLALPGLVAYALLKHRLFDIDMKIKWTIRQSTVAAVFIGVFFVAAMVAQEFLTESFGWAAGGVVAGLLVFVLAPLQRAAERVANAAMPGVRAAAELTGRERVLLYREQARLAWADGNLSADERRLLDGLRERLGVSHEEASRIERDLVG
ncbi:MAG: hypothetical protein ACT4PT_03235 [Methanobacteriota archaeon]